MTRLCECGCGRELVGKRADAKFYRNSCRYRNRDRNRPAHATTYLRPFVGLDGEGIGRSYVLLACGNGESISTKKGLSTEACLDFLINLPKGSNSGVKPIYVWFAFDYDVNMILGDIPFTGPNSIEELRTNNTINWHGYHITYLRRKILRIRYRNRTHTSTDIWGYFQCSFEKALEKWDIQSSKIIEKGKASRSDFSKWSLKRIEEYNAEELRLLASLAESLRDSVKPLELRVQSWHGPAALASSWLSKNKMKRYLSETPKHVFDAVSRAYFGGRIDTVGYGIVDPVYHYDIVSAYPAATRNLPDLTKLAWIRKTMRARNRLPNGRMYVARISWQLTGKIADTHWGPFPWRGRDGSIAYPPEGEGWYWNCELEAAVQKFPNMQFRIHEYYQAEGDFQFPFSDLITETFNYRAKLKAANDPSHVPVKLILNSLYGKFAQTVGKANFYSLIWAGLVTAQTRAQMTTALTNSCVLAMTDSLWASEPLDLDLGTNLGQWEAGTEKRLWLAGAGLYEYESEDGSHSIFQRGFDKRNPVQIQKVVNAWLSDNDSENNKDYWPIYSVNRFVGMGLASITNYPWREWVQIERSITPLSVAGTSKRWWWDNGKTDNFVWLQIRDRLEDACSYPYMPLIQDPKVIVERMLDETFDETE